MTNMVQGDQETLVKDRPFWKVWSRSLMTVNAVYIFAVFARFSWRWCLRLWLFPRLDVWCIVGSYKLLWELISEWLRGSQWCHLLFTRDIWLGQVEELSSRSPGLLDQIISCCWPFQWSDGINPHTEAQEALPRPRELVHSHSNAWSMVNSVSAQWLYESQSHTPPYIASRWVGD